LFELYANKTQLTVRQREAVTSGSVNAYRVRFEFSEAWEGLSKTAIFRAGVESRAVLLGEDNEAMVPWEVLKKPAVNLFCGVYGALDEKMVLPTIWANLGIILNGAAPDGEVLPPTPELWEQALSRKGDGLSYDGQNLSLMSGDKPLSTVQVAGGDGEGYIPVPGPQGPEGPQGPKGDPGEGVPSGGAPGQVLSKASDADYDTQWVDPPEGGAEGSAYTPGDGITIQDDTISVDTPVRGIVTQAEFDALPEEEKAKGLYVIDDGKNGGSSPGSSSMENYSTEETVIGTWIDGKPLYRKTLTAVTPGASLTEWIDVSDMSIDAVIRTGGTIYGRSIPLISSSIVFSVWLIASKKYLACYIKEDENSYKNIPASVILEYTKTTDLEVTT